MIVSRIGYRGATLTFLAVVWFAVGANLIADGDPDPAHRTLLELLPMWVRVAVWWVAAAVAMVTAWWPPTRPKWGYTALVVPAAFRALSYGGAATFAGWHAVTGTESWTFVVATVADTAVWLGITFYILTCAGWPEPPHEDR